MAAARPARPLIALTLIGIVAAVIGGVLLVLPSQADDGDETAAEKAVVARVSDFAAAYNTYDVADLEDYQQRVGPMLTDDYRAQFVEITTALFTAIEDKQQTSGDVDVKSVAVESIDEDSAVVLAVVDAQVRNTDNDEAVLRQFRWRLQLERDGDQWLIAQFEAVPAQPADADENATPSPGTDELVPTPTPSATATEEGE